MAAGDIINNQGFSRIEAGTPSWTPVGNQSKLAIVENTGQVYYYNTGTTAWVLIDLDAIAGITLDGTDHPVVAGDDIAGVVPTAGQVPNPIDGDTASKFLTDGTLEKYVYMTGAWTIAYTLAANEAANLTYTSSPTIGTVVSSSGTDAIIPAASAAIAGLFTADLFADLTDLIALTGVDGNASDLGTFTGTTIVDASTIKAALQALETAIELGTAISATQDNEFEITKIADGIRVTKQALTAFNSFVLAQASALAVGDAFVLTINNLDGITSDGVTGPVFRKQ